jgi:hypothetical protein
VAFSGARLFTKLSTETAAKLHYARISLRCFFKFQFNYGKLGGHFGLKYGDPIQTLLQA